MEVATTALKVINEEQGKRAITNLEKRRNINRLR
jgi:hypothetical protein